MTIEQENRRAASLVVHRWPGPWGVGRFVRCELAGRRSVRKARMSLKYFRLAASILASALVVASNRPVAAKSFKALNAQHSPRVIQITPRRHSRKGVRYGQSHRETRNGPGADYYEHDSSKLRFGTQRWLEQMRRENRLGNPG